VGMADGRWQIAVVGVEALKLEVAPSPRLDPVSLAVEKVQALPIRY